MIRVIQVTQPGGPEVLNLAEQPEPVAKADEIVVRVHAANINPTDLAARMGYGATSPPKPPYVLGWDFAGKVQAIGDDVSEFKPGDRVVGMIPWYSDKGSRGAYVEAVAVKAEWAVPLPTSISYEVASTIPLNSLTAKQALDMLDVAPQSDILVTGASGGVGGFAVQLALREGHRVSAVAGRDDVAWVDELGAQVVHPRDVDYSRIGRFDWVFDAVPVGAKVLAAVAGGGVVISTRPVEKADPDRHIRQEVVLVQSDRKILKEMVQLTAEGILKTRVAQTFPLENAREAHQRYEQGGLKGKIVLRS